MEVGTFRGITRASGCLFLPGFQYGRDDIGQRRGDQCEQLSRGPGGDTQIDPPAGSTEWGRGGSVVKMISVNSYRVVLEEILKLTHQGAALNVNGVASVVEDQ